MTMLTFVSDFHSQKVVGTAYFYEAGRTYDVPAEILDEVLSSGAVGATDLAPSPVAGAPTDAPVADAVVDTPIEPAEVVADPSAYATEFAAQVAADAAEETADQV